MALQIQDKFEIECAPPTESFHNKIGYFPSAVIDLWKYENDIFLFDVKYWLYIGTGCSLPPNSLFCLNIIITLVTLLEVIEDTML